MFDYIIGITTIIRFHISLDKSSINKREENPCSSR